MRSRVVWTLLGAVLILSGCQLTGVASGPSTPESPNNPPISAVPTHRYDPSVSYRALKASIEKAGVTFCPINSIIPNVQGGNAVINIFSFSSTRKCDAASTAHQGIIYFAQEPTHADAGYLLATALKNPIFETGWRTGQVAIIVGTGTSSASYGAVSAALNDKAELYFSCGRYPGRGVPEAPDCSVRH